MPYRSLESSNVGTLTPRDGLIMNNCRSTATKQLLGLYLYPRTNSQLTSLVLTLFKHRLDTFADFKFNDRPDWLMQATRHPATFHAILYCGAIIYADYVKKLYQEICPKSGCMPYKIEAIRAINQNLGEISTAVSDEMILAVLVLMNFDSVSLTKTRFSRK